MILGALLELGAPGDEIQSLLDRLAIDGLVLQRERVQRGALAASYVSFAGPTRAPAERRFGSIRALLEKAPLPDRVREASLRVFTSGVTRVRRSSGWTP